MLIKVTKIFLKKKNGKGVKYYREHRKNLPEDKNKRQQNIENVTTQHTKNKGQASFLLNICF